MHSIDTSSLGTCYPLASMGSFQGNRASQTFSLREAWVDAFERRVLVHAVLVDFTKAFDRVNHDVLLQKLQQLGIAGKVLGWIEAYLTWRVELGSCKSMSAAASSSVPQGAVIGTRLHSLRL